MIKFALMVLFVLGVTYAVFGRIIGAWLEWRLENDSRRTNE